jgi:hypothetical protein
MEDWQRLLDEIGRMHEQEKVDLLVIDSLAKLAPLSRENDAGEMLKALEPLERLAQAGMSVPWSPVISLAMPFSNRPTIGR